MQKLLHENEKTEKIERNEKIENRTADFIKTVLIYVLTFSMLVSAGWYINVRQNAGREAGAAWENRSIFAIGGTFFTEMDETHFYPVQITVTLNGRSRTAVYNDTLVSRVYYDYFRDNYFMFVLLQIFSRTEAESIMLDRAEGEELWRMAAASENSVYIRYAGDYIYPIIYALLRESFESVEISGPVAEVRELFIFDADPIFGVSRDSRGNIAAFRPSEESRIRGETAQRISIALQAAYNGIEGGVPGRFLNSDIISGETGANRNDIKNLSFCPGFHLFDNHEFSRVLSVENPLVDDYGRIDTQKSAVRDLFRLLNFNHESAYHAPIVNGISYTSGSRSVRFINNGQIIYTNREPANNRSARHSGGLHLVRFLGFDAGYFTFFEKLRAASAFANAVSRDLAGGRESSLFLKDIFFENDVLNVIFAYYHTGAEVRIRGTEGAIILRITQDGINEVVINTARISSQRMIKNINPIIILSETDRLISEDIANAANYEKNPEEWEAFFEGLSVKYNLKYDKNRGKFIVNQVELVYNVDYLSGSKEVAPVWVIR